MQPGFQSRARERSPYATLPVEKTEEEEEGEEKDG